MIAAAISILFGLAAALAVWAIADSLAKGIAYHRFIRRELAKLSETGR